MQEQQHQRVRTFTMGFDAEGYDEAARARAIAEHLGTDHTTLRVTRRAIESISAAGW